MKSRNKKSLRVGTRTSSALILSASIVSVVASNVASADNRGINVDVAKTSTGTEVVNKIENSDSSKSANGDTSKPEEQKETWVKKAWDKTKEVFGNAKTAVAETLQSLKNEGFVKAYEEHPVLMSVATLVVPGLIAYAICKLNQIETIDANSNSKREEVKENEDSTNNEEPVSNNQSTDDGEPDSDDLSTDEE